MRPGKFAETATGIDMRPVTVPKERTKCPQPTTRASRSTPRQALIPSRRSTTVSRRRQIVSQTSTMRHTASASSPARNALTRCEADRDTSAQQTAEATPQPPAETAATVPVIRASKHVKVSETDGSHRRFFRFFGRSSEPRERSDATIDERPTTGKEKTKDDDHVPQPTSNDIEPQADG